MPAKGGQKLVPRALTIATSDSGGGAGIQADLKAFAAAGCHGTSVLVALTAQNTTAVTAVHELPTEFVVAQLDAVFDDIGVDAAKTGMLFSERLIETVAGFLEHHRVSLVVDPVMVASSGAKLLQDDAVGTYVERLFPLATVVTPNLREAEVLAGGPGSRRELAERIHAAGAPAVIVTGGHGGSRSTTCSTACAMSRSRSTGTTGRRPTAPVARTRRRSPPSSHGARASRRRRGRPRAQRRKRCGTGSTRSVTARVRSTCSAFGARHDRGGRDARHIRDEKPLVHQITNYVVMNETANATLALGALPVMAHAREEVEEMAGLANALVLNIGTLSPPWVDAMLSAGHAAGERGIPVVLDPVGAGATRYRTETAKRVLAEVPVTVLRGNAGEIATLVGVEAEVRGVESMAAGEDSAGLARAPRGARLVAAVTGAIDHVSDGERVFAVANGTRFSRPSAGTGCMSTAITGSFLAVKPEVTLEAAAEALVAFGVAGEDAARTRRGPGTFHAGLYDALAELDPATLDGRARVEEL